MSVRWLVFAALVAGLGGFPASALAGVFGGFADDGTAYLRGRDQICEPVTDGSSLPKCEQASASKVAARHFRRGAKQSGSRAVVSAKSHGSRIEVWADGDKPELTWSSTSAVSEIVAVYLHEKHGLVAVEYRTRLGGRTLDDVVVFRVDSVKTRGKVGGGGTGTMSSGGKTDSPSDVAAPMPKDDAAMVKAIAAGRKLARRRKHAAAIAQYESAAAVAPDHPEPHYQMALSYAGLKDDKKAIAHLEKVRDSKHPRAAEWMIDARFAREFKKLRADNAFRRAVGLDSSVKREKSAYERVVGLGGQWEQAAIQCEDPQVNLDLDRKNRKFKLVIKSKCAGGTDVTRLGGTWNVRGKAKLLLTFPNQGSDADALTCQVELCRDSSGEDCIRCQPEPDLEFLLRVVRR